MTSSFGGIDSEFYTAWQALTYGGGTRDNKRLPAPKVTPEIPARVGSSGRIVSPSESGSGSSDMTLTGSKIYTSTDGLITLSFPNSVQVVVAGTYLTIPAIIST